MDAELLIRGTSLSDEFECELGDQRRTARVKLIADALLAAPDSSYPEAMPDPAELEAYYRVVSNDSISFHGIFEAHQKATAARVASFDEILVVHDTTEFAWNLRDENLRENLSRHSRLRQGFYGHFSLAVSADGMRVPLGVAEMLGYVHESKASQACLDYWQQQFFKYDSEGERWVESFRRVEQLFDTSVIHVCDREADMNAVLNELAQTDGRFVIRAYHENRSDTEGRTVSERLAQQDFKGKRTIKLSARSLHNVPPRSRTYPERPRREATLSFRACTLELNLKNPSETIPMNVVEALELNPPEGQEPVRWVLLTSEPVATTRDILKVIDIYRSRWLIEEYFKAIKTGCAYQKRQLDSADALLTALALTIPIAWTLLALRHISRQEVELAASALFSDLQLALLKAQTPKLDWPRNPSIVDACAGLARLGGHHHSNGPPGWQILGRGLQKLLTLEKGARLAARAGLT